MDIRPITHLALLEPDLREDIDQVADLAWLTLVLTLKEPIYPSRVIGLDLDRIQHHLDLLGTFMVSASVPGKEIEWDKQSLLKEFDEALSNLKAKLEKLNPGYLGNLEFYYFVRRCLTDYGQDRPGLRELDAAHFLTLADTCFDMLVLLEQTPEASVTY